MDLFKPRGASQPRRPTDDVQQHGQITNQPRYARLGGLDKAGAIGGKNQMGVKKPGDGRKVI